MKLNVWKIQELPSKVWKVKAKKNRNAVRMKLKEDYVNGYIFHKGYASIIGDKDRLGKSFNYQEGEFKDLSQEHQKSLLYHIIDDTLKKKGFKFIKRQRIFFLPKEVSTDLLKISADRDIYMNIGFKYSISILNNRLLFLVNPTQVITSDGSTYDNKFAFDQNAKVLSDPKLKSRYSYNCQILDKVIEIMKAGAGSIVYDYGENGRLVLEDSSEVEIQVFSEPEIDFGKGNYHTWAKSGLNRYGPLDYNEGHVTKPDKIKVSLIGTSQSFSLLETMYKGEEGKEYPFKGFKQIFKTDLQMGSERFVQLSDTEVSGANSTDEVVELILSKAINLQNQQIDFDICLVELVPGWERFFINQEKDLRDLLKVKAWKNRIKTQLYTKRTNEVVSTETLNNLSLGIYYKAGGNPWRMRTKFTDTAYIGISFGYSETDKKRLVGVAEIFDNYGQFISLRSVTVKEVSLDERIEEKRDVHLTTEQLEKLVGALLEDYYTTMDSSYPESLIIHKTTYFNKFEKACLKTLGQFPINFSLVHLQRDHSWNLITDDGKEPTRGSYFRLNNNKAILYTSGLLGNQKHYFLPGTPRPYLVNLESESNFTIKQICQQVLELTKLNFNSTNTYSKEPVTLLHSRDIVDLLRVGLEPINIPSDPRYFL